MTDIEHALVEALLSDDATDIILHRAWDTPALAAALIATEPMQAIARDAAVGRAAMKVFHFDGTGPQSEYWQAARRAIAAALGEDE